MPFMKKTARPLKPGRRRKHDERSLGAVALQGFRQHKGQGLSPKAVRQGRQLAGAVLKGYGADPSRLFVPVPSARLSFGEICSILWAVKGRY